MTCGVAEPSDLGISVRRQSPLIWALVGLSGAHFGLVNVHCYLHRSPCSSAADVPLLFTPLALQQQCSSDRHRPHPGRRHAGYRLGRHDHGASGRAHCQAEAEGEGLLL